jgi:hypothetical protein
VRAGCLGSVLVGDLWGSVGSLGVKNGLEVKGAKRCFGDFGRDFGSAGSFDF